MGQSSSSISVRNYTARIKTKDGTTRTMSYHSLVEHIILLRKVIHHPEMTEDGPTLSYFIKEYCKRMAKGKMKTADQQLKLPWQIEWVWHVHRLHPLNYLNDCKEQLSDGLVNKQARVFIQKHGKKRKLKKIFSSKSNYSLFNPSIDLKSAVIRQKDFLDKFQKHFLYSYNLEWFSELNFQNLVQDYVSFIKLADKNQLIVPTFDIDLIWHTYMRYPSQYHAFSKALCGFILDHNDSIESNILADAYQTTADRWKETYQSEYGKNIDRKHLETSYYMSSCAIVYDPYSISTTARTTVRTTAETTDRTIVRRRSHSPSPNGCGSSNTYTGYTSGGGCDGGGGGSDGGAGCDSGCGGGGCGGSGCGGGGCGGGCGGD